MRVLHVYRTYFPDTQGGLEEVIRQVCRNTRAANVESRVFTLSPDPVPAVIQQPEAEVHRFPRSIEIASCGISFNALSGFRRLVDWADIIHYHFPWPYADVLHFLGRVKKPTLLTYHSDIVRQKGLLRLYQPLMHRFLDNVHALVATSQNYAGSSKVLQRYADKVEVIPIGLDESGYPPVEDAILTKWRKRTGEGFFLFVGMLRYYKGLHVLLQAMKGVDLPLVIAGKGPEEQALHQQAEKLGLKNTLFTGYISDKDKVALFQLAGAVVFPSCLRSEAFGVTLLESAMFAKAMISTELGTGTSYVNQHEQTGLVVPANDADSLREAMKCLHEDTKRTQVMSKNARKRYEKLFTGEKMGQKYLQLYRTLTGERQ